MKAKYHVITGGITAAALIPVFGYNSVAFLAASVLVDGDHYVDFLYRNGFKDYSIRRMFHFHDKLFIRAKSKEFIGVNIGHTVEFIALVFIAAYFTDWLWLKAIAWGLIFHMACDLIYLWRLGRITRRALSFVEYAVRWRKLKRRGCKPEAIYQVALRDMDNPGGSGTDDTAG